MTSPTHIELLSPARTADIGIEAIRHGADAVYIGAEAFGARAAAGNTVEDIKRLVDFAHQYWARVYVTVNTILYDDELPTVERLCWQLWEVGVDALIVQDLRLLSLHLPPIPLHASTQMDNRTVEKVRQLAALGFPQVVLARELTMEEIAEIHKACPDTELEVFVHGALCVSLSGRCNVSEALFGRSANRGACAQVCRLEFDLLEDDKVLLRNKHLLSLRDNCQLDHLEALLLAGASSLKIEGRLKDMEYVKNVTAAYSEALDKVIAKYPDRFCRRASGRTILKFSPNVWKSFNRGFVKDVSQPDANIDTPKSMGEPLTSIQGTLSNASSPLHNGDGLCYLKDGELIGFRLNQAAQFQPVKGVTYFRNLDIEWDKMLAKPTAQRLIAVRIDLYEDHLEMTDEDGVSSQIPIDLSQAETANTPQAENIRRQLGKLGNTLYEAKSITLHGVEQRFIPSSQLAAWRRTLVGQQDENRRRHYPRQTQEHQPLMVETEKPFELTHDSQVPLMTTKYCLRRQLNCCLKQGGRPANWSLRLKNGKTLRLAFDCKNCMMKVMQFAVCMMYLLLFSCVGSDPVTTPESNDSVETIVNIVDTATVVPDSALIGFTPQQADSLAFRLTHHYTENFNFIVKADSLMLQPREGDLIQDTCQVYEGELIAVAAISIKGDSVWVKVAHDQLTMGWIEERNLLRGAAPDDQISELLYMLSGSRGIWMSLLAAVGIIAFLVRQARHQQLLLLTGNELQSPYPTLFIILTALMASLYASVQNFVPEFWQEYYFHPSLNPLVLPPVMALLVIIVWLLIITFIAVCDEAYHRLEPLKGITMIVEMLGLGMIVYLLISWTTLYYIGYGILPVLLWFCIASFQKKQ